MKIKFPSKNYATIFDFITLPIPLEEVENFTSELQKRSDSLDRQIKIEKKFFEQSIENYFKEFNSSALNFFIKPLLSVANNFLNEVKIYEKGVSDITKKQYNGTYQARKMYLQQRNLRRQ